MNIMKPNFDTIAPQLVSLVEEASQIILQYYEGEFEVTHKEDGSPVTIADQKSHDLLKAGLEKLLPNVPVISEEDETSWSVKNQHYWLIDPLDGTKGFIYKTGDFCINIAFIENDIPIFGLIHIPLTGETYYGYDGNAFLVTGGRKSTIQTRPYPKEGLILLLGGYGKLFKEQELFLRKAYPIKQINRMRSAIKFCHVASGEADLYIRFEPCSEWDTAAGHAIVEAAGGSITLIDGTPFLYGKPKLLNSAFIVFGKKP